MDNSHSDALLFFEAPSDVAHSKCFPSQQTIAKRGWRLALKKQRRSRVLSLLLRGSSLLAFGQSGNPSGVPVDQSGIQAEGPPSTINSQTDELKQELAADTVALSKIAADPFIRPDPVSPILWPVDVLVDHNIHSLRLKFGATYTFLTQYTTSSPGGIRHDQLSGRLDFTGAWAVYDHESTAGSISLLIRSGTNIGMSQPFNLSDRLGSGVYLNCLQGGGPPEPITVNVLYWRQDFLNKRLSLYVSKIHPNQFVALSLFNNDERTQFLNGADDGDLAVASAGTYAPGGAVEFQATKHVFVHSVAVTRRVHSNEISKR